MLCVMNGCAAPVLEERQCGNGQRSEQKRLAWQDYRQAELGLQDCPQALQAAGATGKDDPLHVVAVDVLCDDVGDSFDAGKMGKVVVEARGVAVMGTPFVFNKDNIEEYAAIF